MVFSTLLQASHPPLSDDLEASRLDPANIYLVHASHFLIKNSTAVAGASSLEPELKNHLTLFPTDQCMEIRKTLHHCVGNLVPEDGMGTVLSLGGYKLSIQTKGHGTTPFAYLDLMASFLERQEIFGGQINDLFTTSHHYGATAIAVIPVGQADTFKDNNPDFEGELLLYNPDQQDLRTTVFKILQDKQATIINLNKKKKNPFVHPISSYEEITVADKVVPRSDFEKFFQAYGIPILDHNISHFINIEHLLSYFRQAFIATYKGKNEPWKFSLSSKHIPALTALVEFEFTELFKQIDHVNEQQQKELASWREDCRSFIAFHKLEAALRQQHKSLFYHNPKLQDHILQRHSLNLLTLQDELPLLEAPIIAKIESDTENFAMRAEIPEYYRDLTHHNPLDYILLTHFMRDHFNEWPYGPGIILHKMSGQYFASQVLTDEMITACKFALDHLSLVHNINLIEEIQTNFWIYATKDDSPKGHCTLALLNHPVLNPKLRHVLGFTDEELTFEGLLYSCPYTKPLFQKDTSKYGLMRHAEFIRQKYAAEEYPTLAAAALKSSLLRHQANELYLTPLQAVIPDNSLHAIRLIKEGFFGSLEDIFTSLGLKAEFRKQFRTDDAFWSYSSEGDEDTFISVLIKGPTFYSVYEKLTDMQWVRT
jgi:hypothetical protein